VCRVSVDVVPVSGWLAGALLAGVEDVARTRRRRRRRRRKRRSYQLKTKFICRVSVCRLAQVQGPEWKEMESSRGKADAGRRSQRKHKRLLTASCMPDCCGERGTHVACLQCRCSKMANHTQTHIARTQILTRTYNQPQLRLKNGLVVF
jgi:hypothetical protein